MASRAGAIFNRGHRSDRAARAEERAPAPARAEPRGGAGDGGGAPRRRRAIAFRRAFPQLRTPLTADSRHGDVASAIARRPEALRASLDVVQRNVEVEARFDRQPPRREPPRERPRATRARAARRPSDAPARVIANLAPEIERSGRHLQRRVGAESVDTRRSCGSIKSLISCEVSATRRGSEVIVFDPLIGGDLASSSRHRGGIQPALEEIFSPFSKRAGTTARTWARARDRQRPGGCSQGRIFRVQRR